MGARPGGDVRGADLAMRPGSSGAACSVRPSVLAACGDRRLGAVCDAAQAAGEAGRHREIEVAEELVAVFAVELQRERAEGAGVGFEVPGGQARVERPDLRRGIATPCGPESSPKTWLDRWSAARYSRGRSRLRRCRRVHPVGVAIRPRSDANRCSWNSSNGTCGRSLKTAVTWPVSGSGLIDADQLGVDPEARGDHEQAVLVARLRLADVDRAFEGPVERRRDDREVPDLRAVGAFGRPLGVEVRLRRRCRRVCPSAASGLMVKPGGSSRSPILISEGEAAKPWNCGALISTLRPEAESVSSWSGWRRAPA